MKLLLKSVNSFDKNHKKITIWSVILLFIVFLMQTHTKHFFHKIVLACLFVVSIWSWYAALNLYFDLPNSLQPVTFPVHFGWWGNDFVWSLIFNNQTNVNQTVNFTWGISLLCKRQIHGYYFNAARWVWLLPLSNDTQMNDGVTVTGWLYSVCGNGVQIYDLVWALHYSKNGVSMWTVVFGVDTNDFMNSSNGEREIGAISWKVSNGVNGKFFDTMFGIGNVSSNGITADIGLVSDLIGTFSNIYIQWHVGIGQSLETNEREILTVNLAGTKTLLTNSNEVISSNVINSANKNMLTRCRGNTVQNVNSIGAKKFACIANPSAGVFEIDGSNIDQLANRDIVLQQWDVFISRGAYQWFQSNSNWYLSIYIPNGNLILDSQIKSSLLSDIDNNGFKTSGAWITKWIYMAGNFIVNGLILGSRNAIDANNSIYTSIPYKTFIHGKVASLNTLTNVSTQRIKHIENVLATRPPDMLYIQLTATGSNTYFPNNTWNASMWDLFAWRCADTTQTWSQSQTAWFGAYPVWVFDTDTITAVKSISCPLGHRYPLTIVEKNIPSNFFLK